ncbi:hypothetical protein DPMN_022423 [Dreissena polymorpha]|uniref:Uncharacterized protein n=1 Tax=Dreissena polymorpha TaxID=45954 RepID=A0A9D4SCF2_DREPO|nr:hypothetical protein DPMN_022423 [Dreissena polymorpha]
MLAKVAVLHEGNEPDRSAAQRAESLRSDDMYPVQVTDAVLELVVQTNNTTGNPEISRDFVNIINNQENPPELSALQERRDEIRDHVTNTFSYYGEFYARQGCVQICVKPRSVKLLFELFEDCVSGEITKKLNPVEELIRGIKNFETYKQNVVLYQDHYDSVMNAIASQIRQQFKDRGFTFENESTIPRAELSQKGTILVRVPCPSMHERDQFENTFKSGYMNDLFKPLEDILTAAYGEKCVSLKAHVDDGTHVISEISTTVGRLNENTSEATKLMVPAVSLNEIGFDDEEEKRSVCGSVKPWKIVRKIFGAAYELFGSNKTCRFYPLTSKHICVLNFNRECINHISMDLNGLFMVKKKLLLFQKKRMSIAMPGFQS